MIRIYELSAHAGRLLIFGVALILAYWAFDYSSSNIVRRTNPDLAYSLKPTDAGNVAAAMNKKMSEQGRLNFTSRDVDNVRLALLRDPLNRVLLRTLGVEADLNGRVDTALQAMKLASRVSRRDSIVQLWLGEYARRKGAHSTALAHYSAAMLVKPELQRVVFPTIMDGLDNREVRSAVRPYILIGSRWVYTFVENAADGELDEVLELVAPLTHKMTDARYHQTFRKLLFRLAVVGETRKLASLSQTAFGNADITSLADLSWDNTIIRDRLGSLGWSFIESSNVESFLDEQQSLVITVQPSGEGDAVARDFIVQPGGKYKFSHIVNYSDISARAKLRWTGECLQQSGNSLAWSKDAEDVTKKGVFEISFEVPQNCYLLRATGRISGRDTQVPAGILVAQPKVVIATK